MSNHYQDRRGMGILALVVVVLLIIFAMGLAQSFFSTQVTDISHREVVGRQCVQIAESAIEEALWKVQGRANTPGSELFDSFRSPVFRGQSGTFPIKLGAASLTQQIIVDLNGYELDEIEASVICRKQATYLEYESCGLIRLVAAAKSDLFSTNFRDFRRTVEVLVDFRVVKITPPRPFDRMTIVVRDCGSLVSLGNDEIRACYNTTRGGDGSTKTTLENFKEMMDGFESIPSPYKEQYQGSCDLLKDHIDWERSEINDAEMGDLTLSVSGLEYGQPTEPQGPHLFGYAGYTGVDGTKDFAIACDADEMDFEPLWIRHQVLELEEERLKALEKRSEALDEISNLANSSPPDASAVENAITTLVEQRRLEVTKAKEILDLYRGFQNCMGELTGLNPGETLHDWETKYFIGKLRKSFWRRNATYVVADQKSFWKLIASVHPLSGVVWVKSGPLRFNANRSLQGKLIVAVNGNVEFDNYKGGTTGLDALTVVSFGNASLIGASKVFLILAGRRRSTALRVSAENAVITGGFVVSGRMQPQKPPGGEFSLKVRRDNSLDGGKYAGKAEDKNHFAVIVSPRIRAKGVYRE